MSKGKTDFAFDNGPARPVAGTEAEDEDILDFAPEQSATDAEAEGTLLAEAEADPWWVLVVDDEPEVHDVTRMVLSSMRYNARGIRLLNAYSAREAGELLQRTPQVALILLDVVMESQDAGLRLVKIIREEMGNDEVRIILRTGQPGQAPEGDVIVRYDINDYKAKAELTAQQLFSATIVALRSYEHISALETNRRGLARIIEASASLFQQRSMASFATELLEQLCQLLETPEKGVMCMRWGEAHGVGSSEPCVLAGVGCYADTINQPLCEIADSEAIKAIDSTLRQRQNDYHRSYSTFFLTTGGFGRLREIVIYLQTGRLLRPMDRQLIEVFFSKITVGFDNVYLYEQIGQAQKATVVALAALAEYKDTDTGDHVQRIAALSSAIAKVLKDRGHYTEQLDALFLEQIGMASILHDVGKVSTPDAILKKPAKLDPAEWEIMKQHTTNGSEILKRAAAMVDGQSYLTLGREIARHHHEWYDGSGYPDGLAREMIPLSARIVALADVFDALAHARPYKPAWPVEQAIAYIRERSGTQFDPHVTEAFLTVVDTYLEMQIVSTLS